MNIGQKIRELRSLRGLTQEELANRCELTKGYISQLENDLTEPSISTLEDILLSLGSSFSEFFSEEKDEKIIFTKDDYFEKIEDDQKTKWLVVNSQKNEMEPILVELSKGAETEKDLPHEGEEFGYVLSGGIFLHLGDKKSKVRKGESFYFKPRANHYISNPGKKEARVVWVSTPPSF